MKSKFKQIKRALVKAGLHTYASEVDKALTSRRELKKKAIDLAAAIRDAMGASISDKLSSDMVEGAILDVKAVTQLVVGELNRIEDKLAKGIWDAIEDAGVSEWNGDAPAEDVEDDEIEDDVGEDFEEEGDEDIEDDAGEEDLEISEEDDSEDDLDDEPDEEEVEEDEPDEEEVEED